MTGFEAYKTYILVKHILPTSKKNYKISDRKLLNAWNTQRCNKDGLKFLKLEKQVKPKQLQEMFSCYFINNNDFYLTEIFDDRFEKFKEFSAILKNIEIYFETEMIDIVKFCNKNSISIKSILFNKELPEIVTNSYPHVIIFILNEIFNFVDFIERKELDSLSKARYDILVKNNRILKYVFENRQISIQQFKVILKNVMLQC